VNSLAYNETVEAILFTGYAQITSLVPLHNKSNQQTFSLLGLLPSHLYLFGHSP